VKCVHTSVVVSLSCISAVSKLVYLLTMTKADVYVLPARGVDPDGWGVLTLAENM